MRRWLQETGRDPAPLLADSDLAWVPADDPVLPIPLLNAAALLRAIARVDGPDAPHRIVGEGRAFELGMIGAQAFRGATLREGFHVVAKYMHLHCTHEFITVTDGRGALLIGEGWGVTVGDEEVLHLVQQYVAAVVSEICGLIAGSELCITRVGMVPHPDAGFTHLRPWLGDRVYSNDHRRLDLEIPDVVADRPLPAELRKRFADVEQPDVPLLLEGASLADTVRALVVSMLPEEPPTIDRIVRAAGLSRRTFQRRLSDEGVVFSDLVEQARAQIALGRLSEAVRPSLKDLAAELGYSGQATLTRSVKRWTGVVPSEFVKQR
jgi:AraC-like DNA-binding protein